MGKGFPELVPELVIIQLSFLLLSRSSPACNQERIKEGKRLSKTETRIVHPIVPSPSQMLPDILLIGKLCAFKDKVIHYIRD